MYSRKNTNLTWRHKKFVHSTKDKQMDVGYKVCGIDLLKGLGKHQLTWTDADTRLLRVQKFRKFVFAMGIDLATRRKHGRLFTIKRSDNFRCNFIATRNLTKTNYLQFYVCDMTIYFFRVKGSKCG